MSCVLFTAVMYLQMQKCNCRTPCKIALSNAASAISMMHAGAAAAVVEMIRGRNSTSWFVGQTNPTSKNFVQNKLFYFIKLFGYYEQKLRRNENHLFV